MITIIKLHGVLGEKFGKKWALDVQTTSEAIHAIDTLRPGFKQFLVEYAKVDGYRVTVGRRAMKAVTAKEELQMLTGGQAIAITPVFKGQGGKGFSWGELIVGVILVVVGIVLTASGFGSPFGVPLILFGIGLIAGGAAGLLMGSPKTLGSDNANKTKPSYNFAGPINTIAQGEAYPVCYGDMWCGSAVISAGVGVDDVSTGGVSGSRPGGFSGTGTTIPGGSIWKDRATNPV